MQQFSRDVPVNVQPITSVDPVDVAAQISDVLAGKDFHEFKEFSGWRLKKEPEPKAEPYSEFTILLADRLQRAVRWFVDIFSDVATAIEFLFWVVVVSCFIYFLVRYRERWLSLLNREPSIPRRVPNSLFGIALHDEILPDDVPARILIQWQAGAYREALGLLFRALLLRLIHDAQCDFDDAFTEQECLNEIRRRVDTHLFDYSQQIIHAWQALAYAHRLPADEQIKKFCQDWSLLLKNSDHASSRDVRVGV